MSWQDEAKCAQTDPEAWFPVGKGARPRRTQDLIALCAQCPVRPACADTALKIGAAHGVWAGVDLGDGSLSDGLRRAERRLTPIAKLARRDEAAPRFDADVRGHIKMLQAAGWTMTAIAAAAGLNVSVVSRAAAGKVVAAPATVRAIMGLSAERVSADA